MASGIDILTLAKKHVGETYILGALAPKDNPNWKGPWDCAEFTSWCIYQVSSKLYGCNRSTGDPSTADAYTGFWVNDATNRGLIISIQEAIETPGAALVRKPRQSKIGHIVFSDGKGGTVEAHSARKGVITGNVAGRAWDIGILVPFINYSAVSGALRYTAPTSIYQLSMPMMQGAKVKKIQTELASLGFDPGDIDGFYGPKTAAAVLAFQLKQGDLVADGEVGPLTAAALGISFP
jgi:N-acetylmuramoyl-L-alanine amidase